MMFSENCTARFCRFTKFSPANSNFNCILITFLRIEPYLHKNAHTMSGYLKLDSPFLKILKMKPERKVIPYVKTSSN